MMTSTSASNGNGGNKFRPGHPALCPWMGAKTRLLPSLIPRLEDIPHRCFVDVFGGGGSVFFGRRRRSPVEVYNDRDAELVTTMRMVQKRPDDLAQSMRWDLASREEFDRLKAEDPADLDDLSRARRFLLLQFMAYAGKARGQSFGRSICNPVRWTAKGLMERVSGLHRRLGRAYIECLDACHVIRLYDGPDTLFFLDPPYLHADRHYPQRFGLTDHQRLAERLRDIQGRFVLTVSDVPEMRELYGWAKIETSNTLYTAARGAAKPVTELVISN